MCKLANIKDLAAFVPPFTCIFYTLLSINALFEKYTDLSVLFMKLHYICRFCQKTFKISRPLYLVKYI